MSERSTGLVRLFSGMAANFVVRRGYCSPVQRAFPCFLSFDFARGRNGGSLTLGWGFGGFPEEATEEKSKTSKVLIRLVLLFSGIDITAGHRPPV